MILWMFSWACGGALVVPGEAVPDTETEPSPASKFDCASVPEAAVSLRSISPICSGGNIALQAEALGGHMALGVAGLDAWLGAAPRHDTVRLPDRDWVAGIMVFTETVEDSCAQPPAWGYDVVCEFALVSGTVDLVWEPDPANEDPVLAHGWFTGELQATLTDGVTTFDLVHRWERAEYIEQDLWE